MSIRPFDYRGECYRSIRDFCRRNDVDYGTMVRLCRKFVRAYRDPAVAADWIFGYEKLSYASEPRTFQYQRDLELNKIRAMDGYARRVYRRRLEQNRQRRENLEQYS